MIAFKEGAAAGGRYRAKNVTAAIVKAVAEFGPEAATGFGGIRDAAIESFLGGIRAHSGERGC